MPYKSGFIAYENRVFSTTQPVVFGGTATFDPNMPVSNLANSKLAQAARITSSGPGTIIIQLPFAIPLKCVALLGLKGDWSSFGIKLFGGPIGTLGPSLYSDGETLIGATYSAQQVIHVLEDRITARTIEINFTSTPGDDIGAIWVSDGLDFELQSNWRPGVVDMGKTLSSEGGQITAQVSSRIREFTGSAVMLSLEDVLSISTGVNDGPCIMGLLTLAGKSDPVLFVPTPGNDGLNPSTRQAFSVYGYLQDPEGPARQHNHKTSLEAAWDWGFRILEAR
jgi:hypothetical protein